VLTAAAALFVNANPPQAVTMDAVAAEAGIGEGTLFRAFGSREGLNALCATGRGDDCRGTFMRIDQTGASRTSEGFDPRRSDQRLPNKLELPSKRSGKITQNICTFFVGRKTSAPLQPNHVYHHKTTSSSPRFFATSFKTTLKNASKSRLFGPHHHANFFWKIHQKNYTDCFGGFLIPST
jgi:Bacterial regulatory proteins, tetR family